MKLTQFACLVFLALQVGCATTLNPSWESRIGKFNYDQAVAELGEPTKVTKMRGGVRIAEWRTSSGKAGRVDVVPQIGTSPSNIASVSNRTPVVIPATPDRFLRLTFSPDGKLIAWANDSRYRE